MNRNRTFLLRLAVLLSLVAGGWVVSACSDQQGPVAPEGASFEVLSDSTSTTTTESCDTTTDTCRGPGTIGSGG